MKKAVASFAGSRMVAEHLPTSNWGEAMRSEPIKKNTRQNEKPRKKRLKKIKINKEEDKGERKLTRAAGTAETSTVGTAEACAKGTAGMGATGMAGTGIPTPAATPGPSKVSASRVIGIQIRRKKKKKKKKKESELNRKEKKTNTHKIRLG